MFWERSNLRKKIIVLTFFVLFATLFSSVLAVRAQSTKSYIINNFDSQIKLEKDTTLHIVETIEVEFNQPKHGIFRDIPTIYSAKGRTIKARFNLVSVVDENGSPYRYQVSRQGQSQRIKIGDPETTITGTYVYVISYEMTKVVQRFEEHDEIYWNVTGSAWDTEILFTSATVESPDAEIIQIRCFAATLATCDSGFDKSKAYFSTPIPVGVDRDLTIVVGLNKDNQLAFPSKLQEIGFLIADNWDYIPALIPIIVIMVVWYKKGRDKRFAEGGVYYEPEDKRVETKPLFAREYLPTVYHPIAGLTPSQVGTVVDESVDISDVVAEIVELARLKYLKIETIKKKGILKSNDYQFTKLEKDPQELNSYQHFLLKKIFSKGKKKVLLSSLKNKFYKYLKEYKDQLYQDVAENKLFNGNPEKVRLKWLGLFIGLIVLSLISRIIFISQTGNFGPLLLSILTFIPGILLARSMPRKTAKGYSLYRQIVGLKHYLGKGKWRYEVQEKHLFFEEILPLAISLGVVNKITKDMQDLGVEPPRYFVGTTPTAFAADVKGFNTAASSSLITTPRGTYSGRSGFGGGGFSGGGFGGGGGGSW